MNESDSDIDLRIAERRARAWLAQRFVLKWVENPRDLRLYGFDPDQEWLFYVEDQETLQIGSARYVSVHRVTGEVKEHCCGE